MSRSDTCWRSAEYAAGVVAEHFGKLTNSGRQELEDACNKTQRDVYHNLCRSFATPHERAIQKLVSECRDYERNTRLSGYDPREDDPERSYRHPAEHLIETMKEAIIELEGLTAHQCVFNEDDDNPSGPLLCPICGNDGLV